MPPTPRVAVLANVLAPPPPAPIAPPVVEKVVDEEKEERLYFIVQLLGACRDEKDIVREVVRAFAVPRDQAQDDYKDAVDGLRSRLDDEGAIDAVAWSALANIQVLRQTFMGHATTPVRDRIREVPGQDPDDPENGAIYRNLTPGEHASEVGARVAAAKVALAANEALLKIAGRRSTRWHERPQNVVVAAGGDGFTAEDREFLKSIGALK